MATKPHLNCGASQVKKAVILLRDKGLRYQAQELIKLMCPDIHPHLRDLMIDFAEETGVSGSQWRYPQSWATLIG